MKIKEKMMMIRILACLIILVSINSCNQDYDCGEEEESIKKLLLTSKENFIEVELASIFDFAWDELYVIDGPLSVDAIKKIIKIDYNGVFIQDGTRLYIFILNSSIVRQTTTHCYDFNYFLPMEGKGYVNYSYNSLIKVSMVKTNEGNIVYSVQK